MFGAPNFLLTIPVVPTTYDSSALSARQSSTASGTAFTFTQTATGSSPYAIAALVCDTGSMDIISTVAITFGGTSLTELGSGVYLNNNTISNRWIRVFRGYVSAGASQTVSVTVTQSGRTFTGWATSATFNSVGSIGSLQTAFGNAGSASKSVTSATNHRVWGILATAGALPSFASFSLTQRQTGTSNTPTWVAGDASGSGSVTVSATFNSNDWAIAALDLSP